MGKMKPPSNKTCLLQGLIVLLCIIILCAFFALATLYESWRYPATPPAKHAIQMVSPCGTIIQTDGSIVCQSTGLDPTDAQLHQWLQQGHPIKTY